MPTKLIKRLIERTEEDKNVPEFNKLIYATVNPLWGVPANIFNAFGLAAKAYFTTPKKETEYTLENSKASALSDAGFRKYLGLSYDEKLLPTFSNDTVRLPNDIELEIPTDTTMLKNRIALNLKLQKKNSKYNKSDIVDIAIKSDKQALEALRRTYSTGKPVGVDEWSWNSRKLVKDGEINENPISPLNVFRHYNIRYDKPTNRMYYSKSYDFDTMEHNWDKFVPGNKFYVRGFIDLNKK